MNYLIYTIKKKIIYYFRDTYINDDLLIIFAFIQLIPGMAFLFLKYPYCFIIFFPIGIMVFCIIKSEEQKKIMGVMRGGYGGESRGDYN